MTNFTRRVSGRVPLTLQLIVRSRSSHIAQLMLAFAVTVAAVATPSAADALTTDQPTVPAATPGAAPAVATQPTVPAATPAAAPAVPTRPPTVPAATPAAAPAVPTRPPTVPAATPAAAPAVPTQPPTVLVATPASLDANGISQLTHELNAAPPAATVIVIAPASLEPPEPAASPAVVGLRSASHQIRLVLVGGSGDLAHALTTRGVKLQREYRSANEFDAYVKHHRGQFASLAGLIGAPGNGSGGQSILMLAVVALGAVGLALGARGLYARLTEPPPPDPGPPVRPSLQPERKPRPTPKRHPVNGSDPLGAATVPTSGLARVRSELEPDGYVELDGCLRRVSWSMPRTKPPAPGQWVEVTADHGRMVAHATRQVRKGGQR